MGGHLLSDREELILKAVVHSYITSAEPIGSRAVVKRFTLDISPATVRNVMADLEEAGYLQQVHTSSGRVPTDHGYRYYVDYLMHVQEVTQAERKRIEEDFASKMNDADALLRQTSHLLALISHQTGIVESPSDKSAVVNHIEITPIGGMRVAVLLADNYGRVQTLVVSLEETISVEDAAKLNRFLNKHLRGTAIDRLAHEMHAKLKDFVDEQHALADRALRVLDLVPANRPGQLFLEGATQLFEHPEFRDVERAREVFGLLEERDRIIELLRAGAKSLEPRTSHVVIGSEAHRHGMEEISVVAAPYDINGETVGMLGVLGPRRMPYSRVTGIVEYTAGMLGKLLTRLSR